MISWVDALFTRWGQWVQLGHGLGSKGLSPAWGAVGGGGVASHVPAISIECSRVHDWVRSQARDDQALLLRCYASPGGSRAHATALGMSLRTMYAHQHRLQVAYVRALDRGKDRGQERGQASGRAVQKTGSGLGDEKKVSAQPGRASSEGKRPPQMAALLKK